MLKIFKFKILLLQKMSTEAELGITEFLNKESSGFTGLIKERFSDFNVHEIDKGGEVVPLTNQDIPPDCEQTVAPDPEVKYSSLSDEQKLLISEVHFSMIKMINKDSDSFDPVKINVSEVEKEGRKEIHSILKKFPNIDSNTTEADGVKYIEARPKKHFKGGGRRDWPRERPKYLHFTLYKENMETGEAISLLASKCRSMDKYFGFAGTKDRRGRTTQRVSVSMCSAQQVLGAAKHLYKLEVGNFKYDKTEVRLGDLSGNKFDLVIRNVSVNKEDLEPVMKSLAEFGFINYFGTQRFGTMGVPTHVIGKELIIGNYNNAIDLILKPRDSETLEPMKKARKVWSEEKDAEKALGILRSARKDRSIEGKLLFNLSKKHKNDFVGALEGLPRQQRLLYCHAFQSYIWNKVVSRRIKDHGLKVMKGDLVFKKNPTNEDTVASKDDLIETVENVEDYTIHDIVIPIPGMKVKYPDNEVKDWFEQYLEEENMTFASFDNTVKDYKLPGDYRSIIVKPNDVDWRLEHHDDPIKDLIISAKDKLQQKTIQSQDEGKYKSLVLSFSLPSSSYATMVLREIMKVETDRGSLTKASKRNNCDTQACDTEPESKVPKI